MQISQIHSIKADSNFTLLLFYYKKIYDHLFIFKTPPENPYTVHSYNQKTYTDQSQEKTYNNSFTKLSFNTINKQNTHLHLMNQPM